MLEQSGHRVHLGGNIGIPPLEMLKQGILPVDWVVLELANFQLIDLKHSPFIGVCVKVVPEHLDWHHNLNEYVNAKQQLFRWQKTGDTAIYFAPDPLSTQISSVSEGRRIPYFKQPGALVENERIVIGDKVVCSVQEVALPGEHNWQNVCAAVTAVWQISQDTDALREVVKHFKGLPFRLEFIRDGGGVKYYNDSFGTTPETAKVAIQAFAQPKVIILGGSDKGVEFQELAKAVADNNVKSVITIGQMGPKIAEKLRNEGFDRIITGGNSMDEVVDQASKQAGKGDVVLLSPACASFDMFNNYQDRGEKFNRAVQALA
jgi:UDP-N-acetylmuramoylalanine--D-glutamate ligase